MWINPEETPDLPKFTKEILYRKLHFFVQCKVTWYERVWKGYHTCYRWKRYSSAPQVRTNFKLLTDLLVQEFQKVFFSIKRSKDLLELRLLKGYKKFSTLFQDIDFFISSYSLKYYHYARKKMNLKTPNGVWGNLDFANSKYVLVK